MMTKRECCNARQEAGAWPRSSFRTARRPGEGRRLVAEDALASLVESPSSSRASPSSLSGTSSSPPRPRMERLDEPGPPPQLVSCFSTPSCWSSSASHSAWLSASGRVVGRAHHALGASRLGAWLWPPRSRSRPSSTVMDGSRPYRRSPDCGPGADLSAVLLSAGVHPRGRRPQPARPASRGVGRSPG